MYKRWLFACALSCSALNGFGLELKRNVCVVRPVSDSTLNESYEKMVKALNSNGYFTSARTLLNRNNSFGSGLVYKASDGKFYVITNRHVVGSSLATNVEFTYEDGTKESFENCKVVGVSGSDDVALVMLPQNVDFKETILPYKGTAKEGDELWTVGYPGLGNEPVWQLGKGILSNVSVQMEEFGKDPVIQHTAQVDAGNSGGPLLKRVTKTKKVGKKTETEETYEVVGLNTWKARFRENTNFSIPFSRAELFVDSVLTKKSLMADGADLKKSAGEFVSAVKEGDVDKVTSMVSLEMALNIGSASFSHLLKMADADAQSLLRSGSPEEGLRRMVALSLINNYRKKETLVWLGESKETDSKGAAALQYNGKSIDSKWTKEDGDWKLTYLSGLEFKKGATAAVAHSTPGFSYGDPEFDKGADLSYGYSMGDPDGTILGARIWWCYRYFYLAVGFERFSYDFTYMDWVTKVVDGKEKMEWERVGSSVDMNCLSAALGAQFPMSFNHIQVVPFLGFCSDINLDFGTDASMEGMRYNIGSKFGYLFGNGLMPYVELNYGEFFFGDFLGEDGLSDATMPALQFRLGCAF